MRRIDIAPITTFQPPGAQIAPSPAEARGLRRDEVRLLVTHANKVTHARFGDLADHLEPGDLVVVNASQTVAGELDATLSGEGRRDAVVVHVATDLRNGTWVVEIRVAPDAARAVLDARPGLLLTLAGLDGAAASLTLLAPHPPESSSPTGSGNRLWRASYAGTETLQDLLSRHGRPIAYGYLDRRYPIEDYRTIFGTAPGSAEMPSAARPFTPEVVTRLASRGVAIAPIVLHTGVSSQEVGEAPQSEWFEVGEPTARLVNTTRAGGGRIVAVGTTVTRALESAARGPVGRAEVETSSGWTDHLVTRETPPRIVDGLITGWHDPAASHLLLVEAVAGPRLTQMAYDSAVESGYQWHEFGDSALLLPTRAKVIAA